MTTALPLVIQGAPQTKGFFQVVHSWAEKGDLFKIIYTFLDWTKLSGVVPPEVQPTCDKVRSISNGIKLGITGPRDLVRHVIDFTYATIDWATTGGLNSKEVFGPEVGFTFGIVGFVSPVFDTIELVSKFVEKIPGDIFRVFEGINGVALGVTMTKNFCECVYKIYLNDMCNAQNAEQQEEASQKVLQALLDLAKAVSYIALAVCVVLSVFFAVALPYALFLSLSTAALVFSVCSYFYKGINEMAPPRMILAPANNALVTV